MSQRLLIEVTPRFERDVKRLKKKRVPVELLREVLTLVAQNDAISLETLRRRHRMHDLQGRWGGAKECHVANSGDWLCVWIIEGEIAVFLRTGSHDDIFK